jgi:hypothetical protein
MQLRLGTISAVAAGLVVTTLHLPSATALPPAELFPNQVAISAPGPYGRNAIAGELDTTGIARGREFILVQLPDGGIARLQQTGFEPRSSESALWRGESADHAVSQAVLTLHRGLVAGRLVLEDRTYAIIPGRGSLHSIVELDESAFPECDTSEHDIVDGGGSAVASGAEQAGAVIDLLAVYTANARTAAGGTAGVETMIQSAVDNANTAFTESSVDARYRLVHVQEVSYNNAPDTGAALSWVASDAGVAVLRDQYGADMVSVIVDTPSSCGTGYVQRNPGPGFAAWAFQATDIDCAVGNLTFAHEHGHNAGMEHNPENSSVGSSPGSASFTHSFGHYINGSYRTVMSYSNPCDNGCSRVARHSSADILYNGVPTGIADSRENARTANSTAPIIANFRETVVPGAPVVNVRVAQSLDDVEENNATGSILADSSDLELGYDGFVASEQLLGLRFLNVNIPPGAIITAAYLGFTVDETASTATAATIRALAEDDTAPFGSAAYSLSSRATVGQVDWAIPAWSTVGEFHQTPDIAPLIQALINRSGWAEGNAMGFTLSASGDRTAEAWDGDAPSAPLLHVEYEVSEAPANSPPIAAFTQTIDGLAVSFSDGSTDSDGSVTAWQWDFGDGNSSSARNPDHSYADGGIYTVYLTVSDEDGAGDTASTSFTLEAPPPEPQPPLAPTNLSKSVVQTGKGRNKTVTGVILSWSHSGPEATHFVLQRCLEVVSGKGKNPSVSCDYQDYVANIAGDSRSIAVGTEAGYRYQIRAANAQGSSGYSNSVKI